MADLTSWGSLYQTDAAAKTKVRSTIEEHWVAGIASKDDAAERRCFQTHKLATCCTSDDKYLGAKGQSH